VHRRERGPVRRRKQCPRTERNERLATIRVNRTDAPRVRNGWRRVQTTKTVRVFSFRKPRPVCVFIFRLFARNSPVSGLTRPTAVPNKYGLSDVLNRYAIRRDSLYIYTHVVRIFHFSRDVFVCRTRRAYTYRHVRVRYRALCTYARIF